MWQFSPSTVNLVKNTRNQAIVPQFGNFTVIIAEHVDDMRFQTKIGKVVILRMLNKNHL